MSNKVQIKFKRTKEMVQTKSGKALFRVLKTTCNIVVNQFEREIDIYKSPQDVDNQRQAEEIVFKKLVNLKDLFTKGERKSIWEEWHKNHRPIKKNSLVTFPDIISNREPRCHALHDLIKRFRRFDNGEMVLISKVYVRPYSSVNMVW